MSCVYVSSNRPRSQWYFCFGKCAIEQLFCVLYVVSKRPWSWWYVFWLCPSNLTMVLHLCFQQQTCADSWFFWLLQRAPRMLWNACKSENMMSDIINITITNIIIILNHHNLSPHPHLAHHHHHRLDLKKNISASCLLIFCLSYASSSSSWWWGIARSK